MYWIQICCGSLINTAPLTSSISSHFHIKFYWNHNIHQEIRKLIGTQCSGEQFHYCARAPGNRYLMRHRFISKRLCYQVWCMPIKFSVAGILFEPKTYHWQINNELDTNPCMHIKAYQRSATDQQKYRWAESRSRMQVMKQQSTLCWKKTHQHQHCVDVVNSNIPSKPWKNRDISDHNFTAGRSTDCWN